VIIRAIRSRFRDQILLSKWRCILETEQVIIAVVSYPLKYAGKPVAGKNDSGQTAGHTSARTGQSDIIAVGIVKAEVAQRPRLQGNIGRRPAAVFRHAIGTFDGGHLNTISTPRPGRSPIDPQWMIVTARIAS